MDAENPNKIIFVRRFSPLASGNRDLLLCGLTAVFLILAFPKTDFWPLAFIAFVPFFMALERAGAARSFLLGLVTGILFFAGTLYWFIHVTYLGAVLIVFYCSLYVAAFAALYHYAKGFGLYQRIIFVACSWCALELARANLFSGFGWASLGYSQYTNLPLIQMADLAGVYGVSFVLMAVNISAKEIVDKLRSRQNALGPSALIVILLAAVWLYGYLRLNQRTTGETLDVAIVQANIPQELKWHEPAWPEILEKYFILTRSAALEKPDLIVWPETAFPGYLGEHDDVFGRLRKFVAATGIPVLLGTVVTEEKQYFNSAVLLDEKGETIEQYHKLHLVPFGEFIPFRRWLPFLSQIVPIADFTPGDQLVLFSGMPIPGGFNVLICFEDSIPSLSRAFAKEGSEFFINITNDAWFKDTKAPYLHLQSSVFRAVENRRSVIRAANTGVSGFIGIDGGIRKVLSDTAGKATYVDGFLVQQVSLNDEISVYTRAGDLFGYAAFLLMLALIFQRQMKPAQKDQRT